MAGEFITLKKELMKPFVTHALDEDSDEYINYI
jgi:hypothetical protein